MISRIYECSVVHQRNYPRRHRFAYRIFMLSVDLDELPELGRRLKLFSINRLNVYSLRTRDYLPIGEPMHNSTRPAVRPDVVSDDCAALRNRAASLAQLHGEDWSQGKVQLVTVPRVLGYGFNPVSFYFFRSLNGEPKGAIAEVTNTFREIKTFWLGVDTMRDGAFRLRLPKHFYVSPYSDVDVEFDFILRPPEEKLRLQIDDYIKGQRVLQSVLSGEAVKLTDLRLATFSLKYPILTIKIVASIHWEALRLYLKRVRWFSKSARPDDQRDLFRPHDSLTGKHCS